MDSGDGDLLRVVLHPVHAPGLAAHLEAVPGTTVLTPGDDEATAAALTEYQAPVLMTMHWQDRFLTPGLRWVQATTAGIEQFPIGALERSGVVLTSATGVHASSVGLHAISLLLALVRRLGEAVREAPERRWEPKQAYELSGRTMGVLGLGAIGEEVARLALALGMRVVGTKRTPDGYAGVAERVVAPTHVLDVCREADVLVVTLPAGPETDGLIGHEQLDALGAGWLVNVGRGSVVDEDALEASLRDGALMGAGLDVTREEPLPPHSPLWDLPNVIITPHMAWSSERLAARLASLLERNLAAFRNGDAWVNRVV